MRRALFIYRAPEYSPNNRQKDAAILEAVAARFMKHPEIRADFCTEDDLPLDLDAFDVILHMARRLATLIRLEKLEHAVVINAPRGVRNVAKSRELTLMLLDAAGVQVPDWWAYEPEEDEMFMCNPQLCRLLPGWVKAMRPDGAQSADVTYVSTPLQADRRIIELAAQQVPDIVVTRHVEGDLIKCYCVCTKEPFIDWFYPQETGYSKFGGEAESHNSALSYVPLNNDQLLTIADRISRQLGLEVFGFDAIVQPGTSSNEPPVITVIDVNDWPSFSRCKEKAADAIVNMLF